MSTFALALLVLGWIPGRLLFELGVPADAPTRRWSLGERLFVELALSWLLIAWTALTLVEIGYLSRGSLLLCLGMVTAALAVAVVARGGGLLSGPWKPDPGLLAGLALVVAAAFWYAPGFEQIVGARDPITYNVAGVAMARDGSFRFDEEIVTAIPEPERTALLGADYRELGRGHYGPRFQGWYLLDPSSGAVVPQGFPLYPTAIAVGYLIGDIGGALRTTTVIAIAALVALMYLGRLIAGWPVGITAAALLLVSPAQVWFSRFANAEGIAQLLVIVGLYGFVAFRRHGAPLHGWMAAIAFGLTLQAHPWTAWLAISLFGVLVLDLVRARVGRREVIAFWGPLALLTGHAAVVYMVFVWAYLVDLLRVVNQSRWALLPLLPGIALLLYGCWRWGRRRATTKAPLADQKGGAPAAGSDGGAGIPDGGAVRYVLAAGVFVLAVYGYWIRPAISTEWRAEAIERLVLATTPFAFWLAAAGVVLLILGRRRGDATAMFLVVALGLSVPVLGAPMIRRPLMWSLRRYQTIFPLLFLFAAVALWWFEEQRGRDGATLVKNRLGFALAVLLSVAVVGAVGLEGMHLRGFAQPGAAIALVDEIAASVEDDAVLVFEARSDWGVLNFAPALAYWKGFDVIRLHRENDDGEALYNFVRRQSRAGRAVYFFTQGFNYYFPRPRMVPHRSWTFAENKLEEVIGRLPTEIIANRIVFASYRLEPGGTNGPLEGGLDVGQWDDIYVGEVWPPETPDELTARWTTARSFFWLPGLGTGATQIIVNATTVAGSGGLSRTLQARLDDVDLGEIALEDVWRDYVFEVPSTWQPASGSVPRLELSAEPVRPDEVSGNGDTRRLGVFVNAILWH